MQQKNDKSFRDVYEAVKSNWHVFFIILNILFYWGGPAKNLRLNSYYLIWLMPA
jgi:hypothetical protein